MARKKKTSRKQKGSNILEFPGGAVKKKKSTAKKKKSAPKPKEYVDPDLTEVPFQDAILEIAKLVEREIEEVPVLGEPDSEKLTAIAMSLWNYNSRGNSQINKKTLWSFMNDAYRDLTGVAPEQSALTIEKLLAEVESFLPPDQQKGLRKTARVKLPKQQVAGRDILTYGRLGLNIKKIPLRKQDILLFSILNDLDLVVLEEQDPDARHPLVEDALVQVRKSFASWLKVRGLRPEDEFIIECVPPLFFYVYLHFHESGPVILRNLNIEHLATFFLEFIPDQVMDTPEALGAYPAAISVFFQYLDNIHYLFFPSLRMDIERIEPEYYEVLNEMF